VWDEDSEQVLAEQMNSIPVAMHPQLALIREDTDTEQEIIVGPRVGITRAVERPLRFRRSGNRWTGR
jgi:3-methyladenine DNA glycosylase Mpg